MLAVAVIRKSFEPSVIVSYSFNSSVEATKHGLIAELTSTVVDARAWLHFEILDCSEFIIVKNILHYSVEKKRLVDHLPMCLPSKHSTTGANQPFDNLYFIHLFLKYLRLTIFAGRF